jgi:hypothetical protein
MCSPAKLTRLTNRRFEEFKQEFSAIIEAYKHEFSEQKHTNWKTYETQWRNRLRMPSKK